MSNEKHETVTGIVAKMRREADYIVASAEASVRDGETMAGTPYSSADFDAALDRAMTIRSEADRLEAAHKRELESISMKPDPDWKTICAKCKDGDIEPEHCEYYGEPNGCNSPIYGEHPTVEKSSAVGDAAKLREALKKVEESAAEIMERVRHKDGLAFNTANYIADVANAALAAPARNCDIGTVAAQLERFGKWFPTSPYCDGQVHKMLVGYADWAQMPYESEAAQ